jgi:type VI secretion system secreted protein VgrG
MTICVLSNENLSIASRGGVFASIRKGWRFFTYNAGLRLVAAANNIEFKALSGSIDMLAKLDITVTRARCLPLCKSPVGLSNLPRSSCPQLRGSG